jgi:hypothetical protein
VVVITEIGKVVSRKLFPSSSPGSEKGDNLLTPVTCILLDMLVYVISGVWTDPEAVPIIGIVLYILVFEAFTQAFLAVRWPQYFCATWWKSVADVILCIVAFVIGRQLSQYAIKREQKKTKKQC